MQKQTLQTLKGFRDFLPTEKRSRDYVESKIKTVFERFGFEPLETPTLEYAELLLGKYGNEADKLVYRFTDRGEREVALRYDQTVPTARVLAQYQSELGRGFRRYQIQNVFRADKPQKGRYREFTQCDADIFGVTSSLADAEILAVYYAIYQELGISDLQILINDRETLTSSLSQFATPEVSVYSLIQSIDKLDKLDRSVVEQELVSKGLSPQNATQALATITTTSQSATLSSIVKAAVALGIPEQALVFRPTLARGLDYYTGLIFEGIVPGFTGSVGGGGRYDRLIESLGGPAIPAVGFGLGFDRTVEVCLERKLVTSTQTTQVLVINLAGTVLDAALNAINKIRSRGINAELYPDFPTKLDKPLKYAEKKNIPYALVIGENEVNQGVVTLKNLNTRAQSTQSIEETLELLSN